MATGAAKNFCSQCGTKAQADAAFCIECGAPLGSGRASRLDPDWQRRLAPVIVFGLLLAVGGLAVGIGYSNQPPPNAPLPGSPGGAPAGNPNAALPGDHPPITIPDEVRSVITRMEKIAAEQPDNMEAWKQLAFVQQRAGQVEAAYLDKAEASYRRVLDHDPKDLDALRGLGNVAYDRNDPGKAIEYYQSYLQIEPGDKSVRTDLGTMLLASQQTDLAIQIYQAVLQEDPTFFQAQFNLAIAYRAANQNESALAALHRAKEIATDDESRSRVETLLAQVDASAPAAATGTLRESVEAVFRSHPIVGPRIDRIDWANDQAAKVVLREFPMAGMPPMVRDKFTARLKSGIAQSKKRFASTDPLVIELVDAATGDVMLSLSN